MKIIIQTDLDFTPAGKRRARVVATMQGRALRWYVAGRRYKSLPLTAENIALSKQWVDRR